MARILAVDDERAILDALARVLGRDGHEVVKAADPTAVPGTDLSRFDLVLCDVMMPGLDGFELVRQIRPDFDGPIIFLTASDEEVNVIRGLDSGGDDYITKPFKLGELLSRIRALLRRAGISAAQPANQMQCGDLTIDLLSGRAAMCGHPLELTQAEFRLLCILVRNAGRVVTREVILNDLWDNAGDFVDDNTLSVYMRRLRGKLERDPSHPEYLRTIRGLGYQWKEAGE
mgnify:CR=1 FL=1